MYHPNARIVKKAQIALRNGDCYADVVDGYIGQDTANGIQRFSGSSRPESKAHYRPIASGLAWSNE
jgi:hypothetical protein